MKNTPIKVTVDLSIQPCPICQQRSVFIEDVDRYFHIDGTSNVTCWITRGDQ